VGVFGVADLARHLGTGAGPMRRSWAAMAGFVAVR